MAEGDLHRTFTVDGETVPVYRQPEIPAGVISHALAYDAWQQKPAKTIPSYSHIDLAAAKAICTKALAQRGAGWLGSEETYAILAAMNLPVVQCKIAKTEEDAVTLARETGFPVAVKLASHRIVHKTESGAVRLNLQSEQDVREAYQAIRTRLLHDRNLDAMEGVLVQPMLSVGVEVMVGMTRDRLFGALIAFGLGGIYIEILNDVRFCLTPLTDRDATEMVRGIKGYRLLQGYRGQPAADVKAIEDVLLRISYLVEEIPAITELDLNPIFALPDAQGCRIVDERIRLEMRTALNPY
jgi:acyl-CoA synthetase (NDP forming)